MAISTEIEKLERRWQQTAGLVFAPLAEAYRKAGLHAKALEILDQGLALHPEYGPALIVRGRCHLDTGGLAEAEAAFQQALSRDPMDPIALRGMADVFARTGRVPEAIERLNLLVEIDPRNVEARQTLERLLREPVPAAPPAQAEEPAAPPEEPAAPPEEPAAPPAEAAAPVSADETSGAAGVEVASLSEPATPPQPEPVQPSAPEPDPFFAAVPEPSPEPEPPSASAPTPQPERFAPSAPAPTPAEPEPPLADLPIEFVNLSGDDDMPEASEGLTAARMDSELTVESFAVEPFEPPASQPIEPEPPRAEPVMPISWTPAPMEPPAPPEPEPVDEPEPAEEPAPAPTPEPGGSFMSVLGNTAEVPPPPPEPTPEPEPEPAPEPEPVVTWVAASEEEPDYASAMQVPIEPLVEPPPTPEAVESEPVASAAGTEDEAEAEDGEDVVASTPAGEMTPELIVTESMAELFLKQGHRELSLAVYRQLVQRSPDSSQLQEAIERIELELGQRPPAPARQNYAASDTGGRSVGAMLQSVLQAEPPAAASSVLPPAIEPPAGEPARAGGEALPLSAVFGDEPAVPPRSEPAPPAAAEPSYDEFFGAAGKESPPTGTGERNPEAEDLRQFNEWLKGLKR